MPEETYQGMILTLITQYINIAIVIYLVNFRFVNIEDYPALSMFIEKLPFFNGRYTDFTVGWYEQVGSALCLTVFIQVIVP